jgi:regulatory subunit for Cdc7p protein kinase
MATALVRRPLFARTAAQDTVVFSPVKVVTAVHKESGPKRPRSPDPPAEPHTTSHSSAKRAKAVDPAAAEAQRAAKEQKRAEREQQKAEFKASYVKAFPSWVFYFDTDHLDHEAVAHRDRLHSKIGLLGAVRLRGRPFFLSTLPCV